MPGCRVTEEIFGIKIEEKAELVIVSSGGYPKDIQLYQAIKALENSAYAVRDGGVIILLSECSLDNELILVIVKIKSLKRKRFSY